MTHRRGRTRRRPCPRPTPRSRAHPHGASCPPHPGHGNAPAASSDSTRTRSGLTVVMAARLSQQEALPVSAKTCREAFACSGTHLPCPRTHPDATPPPPRHPHHRWRTTAPQSSPYVAPDTSPSRVVQRNAGSHRSIRAHHPRVHRVGQVWHDSIRPGSKVSIILGAVQRTRTSISTDLRDDANPAGHPSRPNQHPGPPTLMAGAPVENCIIGRPVRLPYP